MLSAFRNTASYIALLLAVIGSAGAARAADLCFILQKVKVQPNAKPATSLVDQLVRCDAAGKGVRILHEGPRNSMRAVTVAADGTVLMFETGPIVGANARPQILIFKPDGTLSKTVNLAAINGRIFGSPFLLPDQKHLGLTICKPDPQSPDPKPAPGPFEERQFVRQVGVRAMGRWPAPVAAPRGGRGPRREKPQGNRPWRAPPLVR